MIKIGCCGLTGMPLIQYSSQFDVVELQSTFYRLPLSKTAERWRAQVPPNFTYALKVFQGVTHPISSPTWRKAGGQKPKIRVENYGHLRPTEENFECWRRSMEICRILDAKICVVQLPSSFECSEHSFKNMKEFFNSVERPVRVAIETRHISWDRNPGLLAEVLKEIDAIHITDPLLKPPIHLKDVAYFRLHGLGRRLYAYTYTDKDLSELQKIISSLECSEIYIMFNNMSMREDALRFKKLLM